MIVIAARGKVRDLLCAILTQAAALVSRTYVVNMAATVFR